MCRHKEVVYMLSMYPAFFYKEKEGGYSVIFPELGISTCGDDLNAAANMAVDCLAGFLYDLKLEKKTYPVAPDISALDPDKEYDEYESVFVNMVTVDVDEYARKHFEKSVKKTEEPAIFFLRNSPIFAKHTVFIHYVT